MLDRQATGMVNWLINMHLFVVAFNNLYTLVRLSVEWKLTSPQVTQRSHQRPQMEEKSSVTFLCVNRLYWELYVLCFCLILFRRVPQLLIGKKCSYAERNYWMTGIFKCLPVVEPIYCTVVTTRASFGWISRTVQQWTCRECARNYYHFISCAQRSRVHLGNACLVAAMFSRFSCLLTPHYAFVGQALGQILSFFLLKQLIF